MTHRFARTMRQAAVVSASMLLTVPVPLRALVSALGCWYATKVYLTHRCFTVPSNSKAASHSTLRRPLDRVHQHLTVLSYSAPASHYDGRAL